MSKLDYSDSEEIDPDSPTFSFTSGNSIAIMKCKGKKKSKIIFVKDSIKPTEDYIPAIEVKSCEFHQIPNIQAKRDCLYICAPNQSGKTTYLGEYLKYFKKTFPKKNIFLFSALHEDPILDKYKPTRVVINEDLLINPIKPEDLQGSFCIFDDIDQIRNKKIRKEIYSMIEEILCNGAHNKISIAVTHHLMTNYKETRTILNEASSITFFPKGGSAQQIKYTLKNYYGLSKKQIQEILNLPSRWVTLFRCYPQVILYSKGLYLL